MTHFLYKMLLLIHYSSNFKGGLSKVGHEWVISSHINADVYVLTNILILVLEKKGPVLVAI